MFQNPQAFVTNGHAEADAMVLRAVGAAEGEKITTVGESR